jgi:hypothetical protein
MKSNCRNLTLLTIFLFIYSFVNAQNIAITDDDGYTADGSAMLDIKSEDKGLLVPRLSTTQRSAIATPATGLLVYDTDENAFFYYAGAKGWLNLSAEIVGPASAGVDSALFSVVNPSGDTVFAVYPEGVYIWVGDGTAKGNRGGFAVGGLSSGGKAPAYNENFFEVTPGEVRIRIDTIEAEKGNRGGFAVGGLSSNGGKQDNYDFMQISPGDVKFFVDTVASDKGNRGGFAVGGLSNNGKTSNKQYLAVTSDSTRIYVNDSTAGFAVGSIEGGTAESFLNLTTQNYFIGHESGDAIENGKYNVFLGYQSGKDNSQGDDNVFIGYRSGAGNKNGHRNIFLGRETGDTNILGSENIFLGYHAGSNNVTGSRNIFLGYRSGFGNVGYAETPSDEGSFNTFIGVESGFNNTKGESNTLIGYQAGYSNTIGTHNTFVGRWAGEGTGGSYNVFIGTEAGRYVGNESNLLYIDSRVTESTDPPLIYGEFDNRGMAIDDDQLFGYTFYVNGTGGATGGFEAAGKLVKTNKASISGSLDRILKLNGIQYDYKTKKGDTRTRLGLNEQELFDYVPEVIRKIDDETVGIDYNGMIPVLVEAIKDLSAEIEQMKAEQQQQIKALEKKIEELSK